MGALVAGEGDEGLADVHAHDLVEPVGQGQGVAAGPAAGVQGAPTPAGQLGQQPVQDRGRFQAGVAVVVDREAIEQLRIGPGS